ncbi:hypothetical protein CL634_02220 [bacterium]|nr:hypothetical protein [bacterium]|tara:strand:+ start:741 stop:1043 length:303 start_codon:yes stop_codon:yes gene_type:complete
MKPLNKWSQRELADRYGDLKQFEAELATVKNEIKRRYDTDGTLLFKGYTWLLALSFMKGRTTLDREKLEAKFGDLSAYEKTGEPSMRMNLTNRDEWPKVA